MIGKETTSALSVFFFFVLFFIVIGLFIFGGFLHKNQVTFQQFLIKNSEKIKKAEQDIQILFMETENNKNRIEEKTKKIMELEDSIETFNNNINETNKNIIATNKKVDGFIKDNKGFFSKLSKKVDDNNNAQNKKIVEQNRKLEEQNKKLEEFKSQLASINSKISTPLLKNDDLSNNRSDIVTNTPIKEHPNNKTNNSSNVVTNNNVEKDISAIKEQLNNKTDGVMTRLVDLETKIGSKVDNSEEKPTTERSSYIDITGSTEEYEKKIDNIDKN